jgi:hypothetical protein
MAHSIVLGMYLACFLRMRRFRSLWILFVVLAVVQPLFASDAPEILTGSLVALPSPESEAKKAWEAQRHHPLHPAGSSGSSANQRGVFLTAWGMTSASIVDRTIKTLHALQGDAIVFDVKGNNVYIASTAPLVDELGLELKLFDLPKAVQSLHGRGIEAIARFDAISDDGLTGVRPETEIRHPRGGYSLSDGWIDPANPLALDYNSQVLCEVAAAGVDEINLDYIRYATEDAGKLAVYTPEQKIEKIEAFIRMARETIDRCGPGTRLGLSTFAILGWDFKANVKSLGQDIARFAPMVDVISPMAYPISFSESYDARTGYPGSRTYGLVRRTLEGYKELAGAEHAWKIRPWIQGFGGFTSGDIANEIRAVYDSGLCGFTVWNAGGEYQASYAAMERQAPPAECAS